MLPVAPQTLVSIGGTSMEHGKFAEVELIELDQFTAQAAAQQ